MLLEIENAIIKRLATDPELKYVRVVSFPDDPAAWSKPVTSDQLFVGFQQETLDPPQRVNFDAPIIQERSLSYEIVFRVRDIRTHERLLLLMELVQELLTGFQPITSTKPLFMTRGGFVNFSQGLWLYSQTYRCATVYQHVDRSKFQTWPS